jgi:GTP diphosphokinase / guanosine-3',5'-bis(diphosphate) 3'-diphosphatase
MTSLTAPSSAGDATTGVVAELLEPVLQAFSKQHPGVETLEIVRAARVAAEAHHGQVRRSGEPYVSHPVAVAGIAADLGLDETTVVAALLHDAVEDTGITLEDLERDFGSEVAAVVDGVTKLDRLAFDSKEAQQAATIRKMFIAMASDWRVLLIKLADRLHNMRTLAVMPVPKQQRIAQETLDVYAPLAHRLGVQQVKWQLEDLCFATLHPKRYAEIEQMVAARAPERDAYVGNVLDQLRRQLAEAGVACEVSGRSKHLWSIYEKMVVRGKEFDDIFDLVGLRIIATEERDCWAALGVIHASWRPVQGRFKDYINSPKFNLYQSLHTTVIGPGGKPVEIQIRTTEMHAKAEYGIAAHWSYKEAGSAAELAWMQRITDADVESSDPVRFLESIKADLEQDEVYVFTPKGRVIALSADSTPVDFAYAVHTEIGHRCIGAKVNGRLVPLDSRLASADTVEIFTSKSESAGPSRDWVNFVASSRARNKIRQWFSRERREDALESGREAMTKELRRESMPIATTLSSAAFSAVAESLNLADDESLFVAIGEGQISASSVVQRLLREMRGGEEQIATTVTRSSRTPRSPHRRTAGIWVEGLDDVMVHLARCCTPVPGDQIIGFVTQGRGVSVHRSDCSNAEALGERSQDRVIEVEWDASGEGVFRATLEVLAFDRSRLLADITQTVSEHRLNIVAARTATTADRVSRMTFDIELADPNHLEALINSIRLLDGVFDAYRVLPGARR